MKLLTIVAPCIYLPMIYAMVAEDTTEISQRNETFDLERREGSHPSRERVCSGSSDGYYVPWEQTSDAIIKWCRAHAGQSVDKGKAIDDGPIKDGPKDGKYFSGSWHVEFYGMFDLSGLKDPTGTID